MDASDFTESSVLLSCFFKNSTSSVQSRVNGIEPTVLIKPIHIKKIVCWELKLCFNSNVINQDHSMNDIHGQTSEQVNLIHEFVGDQI